MKLNSNYYILIPYLVAMIIICQGCIQWAARAKDKLPEETALDRSYSYDGKVIIIGAGAAGMAAAKVFEQNNIDYTILEATNRYGGRLKKDTTLADFPIDVGAEWLHSAPITLNVLKGKKGSDIDEELISYNLNHTATWDGKNYKINPKWENNFRYNFMPESKFKNSTWYDFVDQHLGSSVKHKIQFNTLVTAIDYSGDKVVITTEGGHTYKADKVIVTVSLGVLKSKSISFYPELDKEKRGAIESVDFLTGFKLIMKFSEKFYPDAISCEVNDGEKVYYDIAFRKESHSNILGVLCRGAQAEKYYALNSEQEIIDSLLQELDLIFDGKATSSFQGEYILEDWGHHAFTLGTWTQAIMEKQSQLNNLNRPLDNKVYFAGEINDVYQQMGVPGAILSGYHMADKVLAEK